MAVALAGTPSRRTAAGHRLGLVGPELRRYVGSRGAGDVVDWSGGWTRTSETGSSAAAAVMLLPSVREGWGLAVIEAALQGTPTVAYLSAGGVERVGPRRRDRTAGGHAGDLERAAGSADRPSRSCGTGCRRPAASGRCRSTGSETHPGSRHSSRRLADGQVAGLP